ncbi:MAG: TonB-dependent receptor [Pseudomonadota bacterium]
MNNSFFPKPALLVGICIYNLFALPIWAQSNELAETVVEARLWEERSDRVPASTQRIEDLSNNATADIYLLQRLSANIGLEASSVQTRATIRGITGLDAGLQDPVGYYVNGVGLPLGGNQTPPLSMFESLELIKGPQGALYGRNTETGAIKLNSPTPDWFPSAEISINSFSVEGGDGESGGHILKFSGSNELIENRLAGRISFRGHDETGPMINQLDQSDQGGNINGGSFSAGLLWQSEQDTEVEFNILVDEQDPGRNRFRFDSGMAATDRFVTNADVEGFDDDSTRIYSNEIRHQFNRFELTAITGITDYERQFEIDLDATPAPLPATRLDLENTSVSQEIRISSATPDSEFNWLGGVYFYHESSDIEFEISPMFMTTDRNTEIEQNGRAVFGQLEYQFASNWRASFGGRYERIKQSGDQVRWRKPFGRWRSSRRCWSSSPSRAPSADRKYRRRHRRCRRWRRRRNPPQPWRLVSLRRSLCSHRQLSLLRYPHGAQEYHRRHQPS